MEQTYSFQFLLNIALEDYQKQTGKKLTDHPFAKQLESCDTVESIMAVLQEQAHIFRDFRGDDRKIMKSIKPTVDILHRLSTSNVLGGGRADIGLVRPKSFIGVSCSQSSLDRHSRLRLQYSPALPSCFPYAPFSNPICKSP